MNRNYKKLAIFTMFTIFSAAYVTNVSAYELYGGRYTQDIYSKKYYNDATTYSSFSLMNHRLAFESAISDWNNTSNTRVYWVKTTVKSESILDLTSETSSNDPNLFGYAEFYNGNNRIYDTKNNYWYWVRAWTNEKANFTPPSDAIYTIKGRVLQWASAHEIGHAMGLNHNGTSLTNYSCCSDKLMFFSPLAYWKKNVFQPTSDEVAGVRAIYGTLY